MIIPDRQALDLAATIAERLAYPESVRAQDSGRHHPQSLAAGATGIALLHIERASALRGDWTRAQAWLTSAAREGVSAGPNAGLFFGAPALGFVVRAAAKRLGKLERALAVLDAATTAMTRRRLDEAHARIDRGDRPALAEFDLIRGLTGLGAYHLQAGPDHEITRDVLAYLVRLTEPLPRRLDGLPGWWTDLAPTGRASPDWPDGHGNFGMAHGIAGPLALLSLGLGRGAVVEGHGDAIARICNWLDAWRQEHSSGPWWPRTITPDEDRQGHSARSRPLQPSWCYGTPGVARAQQLAGLATGDTARQRLAEAAMLGCLRDPGQVAQMADIGLCHGAAGLLQTAWRMAADALTPDIAAELPRLVATLLSQVCSAPDEAGFLEGAAGVALALETSRGDSGPLTGWDACLLLG